MSLEWGSYYHHRENTFDWNVVFQGHATFSWGISLQCVLLCYDNLPCVRTRSRLCCAYNNNIPIICFDKYLEKMHLEFSISFWNKNLERRDLNAILSTRMFKLSTFRIRRYLRQEGETAQDYYIWLEALRFKVLKLNPRSTAFQDAFQDA